MPKYTKKEFAAMCGMNTKSLATYIGRGKVVVNDQDLIDDAVGENQGFLLKYSSKKEVKKGSAAPKSSEKAPESANTDYSNNLEALKLEAQVKKLQQEIEKLEHHNSKVKGEVIPSGLIGPLFQQHDQSILAESFHMVDDIILLFAKQKDLTPEEAADIKKRAADRVNEMVRRARRATVQSLDNLFTEFLDKKGVGEHD